MSFGPGDVLDLVREHRARTRAEIAQETGLSRVTVAHRVDALLEAGLVTGDGSAKSTGGRRPTRLAFNVRAGLIAVASIETAHAEVALTDLGGTILDRASPTVDVADGAEVTLTRLADALAELLTRAENLPLVGVGVSLPSPIDPTTGRPSEPPILPGWDAFPVAETLAERLGRQVPVVVRNDADAIGLGEYTALDPSPVALFLVKASTGIGSGLVINGQIYQGHDGAAGDIGHVRVPEAESARCQCGSTGCLAAIASGRAVARQLRELGGSAQSGRDVHELLEQDDPDATRLTQEAGRVIGRVLATAVTMINPGTMLFSGDLASESLLSGIRESLYPAALPRATRHLVIGLGQLGRDAGLVGMAHQVLHQELSASAVNRRLA